MGHGEEAPEQLLAHPKNWRIHPKHQQEALTGLLEEVGWVQNVIVSKTSGFVVDGHARVSIAISRREPSVPVVYVDLSAEEEALVLATFDPIGAMAGADPAQMDALVADAQTDDPALRALLDDLARRAGFLAGLGDAAAGTGPEAGEGAPPLPAPDAARASLAERFVVPPFSVLDARQGYWQERKRAWLALGIQSELGRGGNALGLSEGVLERQAQGTGPYGRANAAPGGSPRPAASLGPDGKTRRGDGHGREIVPGGGGNPLSTARLSRGADGYQAAPQSVNGRGLARTFGQDLMRGEHAVGKAPDSRAIKDHAWQATHLERPQARLQRGDGNALGFSAVATIRRHGVGFDGSAVLRGEAEQVAQASGTSIFDPVLCELAYRWFCPPGGAVLDPFAGGSVRGVVASRLGRPYTGVDLRPEQLAANRLQAGAICAPDDPAPRWIEGDSTDLPELVGGGYRCDLVFSCPPYADLEVYGDDPRDLSVVASRDYGAFLGVYRGIVAQACAALRPDRFAVWVVGDVRGPSGAYRNLVADTVAAFAAAGLALYNDAVLVTAVGSLPIRVGRQFAAGRKLGKTHQNVLVFLKGDARRAVAACGEVEVAFPEEIEGLDDAEDGAGEAVADDA